MCATSGGIQSKFTAVQKIMAERRGKRFEASGEENLAQVEERRRQSYRAKATETSGNKFRRIESFAASVCA